MLRRSLAAIAVFLTAESAAAQQQLGTKVMGGLGIDAGAQNPPGLYIVERFFQFRATTLRDRNGNVVPIQGFDLLARANGLGFVFTLPVEKGPLLTFGMSIPWARISVNSEDPLASVDQFGLGDLFIQPIKTGWRYPRYDFVMAYGFFAPTGSFEQKTGVGAGKGHWTNQVSVGGALYSDSARTWRGSALLSYDMNGRKRGIDITRGNFLALQAGAGASIRRIFTVGVAGYGLWQVSNDRGSQLPARLTGSHTFGYGLGPEVDVTIPALRLKGEIRYEWDFAVRARPDGRVLAVGFSYGAWLPPRPH
ncbi:MAG TPA: transporter [Gemmatimonadaceae bacterium]